MQITPMELAEMMQHLEQARSLLRQRAGQDCLWAAQMASDTSVWAPELVAARWPV